MSASIVACAKNEGPFIIEWIAHHFSIGFDKIFIATNDCDDGTDTLVKLLSQSWPVFHVENSVQIPKLTIQRSAVQKCLKHDAIQDQDWVMHIDLDEFVNIQTAHPNVNDFLDGYDDFDAVMLCWKLFGNEGQKFWNGGSIIDSFQTCQKTLDLIAQKSIFRRTVFNDAAPHCPKSPNKPVDDLKIVNTRKELLDPNITPLKRGTTIRLIEGQETWDAAFVNHYIHKSEDLTRLSLATRGDANGRRNKKRRVGSQHYKDYNKNEAFDNSIQSNRSERIALYNRLMETPGVLEAHYGTVSWFQDQLIRLSQ